MIRYSSDDSTLVLRTDKLIWWERFVMGFGIAFDLNVKTDIELEWEVYKTEGRDE